MSTPFFRVAALSALALAASFSTAQAATLPTDNTWVPFSVDANVVPYSYALFDDLSGDTSFNFTIPAGFIGKLTVVDTGFSGDQFSIKDGATLLGQTSAPVNGDAFGALEFDADTALANSNFSSAVFTLGEGAHSISGLMIKSTSYIDPDSQQLTYTDATMGALRLEVSAVPEPTTLVTLLAGLSLLTVALRRRNNGQK